MGIVVIGAVLLLGSALVVDLYYFNKVVDAETPEQLETACVNDWYKNGRMDSMPAQCNQFYNQGVIIRQSN